MNICRRKIHGFESRAKISAVEETRKKRNWPKSDMNASETAGKGRESHKRFRGRAKSAREFERGPVSSVRENPRAGPIYAARNPCLRRGFPNSVGEFPGRFPGTADYLPFSTLATRKNVKRARRIARPRGNARDSAFLEKVNRELMTVAEGSTATTYSCSRILEKKPEQWLSFFCHAFGYHRRTR